jgi:hypothetical protein
MKVRHKSCLFHLLNSFSPPVPPTSFEIPLTDPFYRVCLLVGRFICQFGKQLQAQQIPTWVAYYLDYKGLKKVRLIDLRSTFSLPPPLSFSPLVPTLEFSRCGRASTPRFSPTDHQLSC